MRNIVAIAASNRDEQICFEAFRKLKMRALFSVAGLRLHPVLLLLLIIISAIPSRKQCNSENLIPELALGIGGLSGHTGPFAGNRGPKQPEGAMAPTVV